MSNEAYAYFPAEGVPAPAQQAELLGILNAHDKLIEALEEIKSTASSVPTGIPALYFRNRQISQMVSIAACALALARGEVQ